MKDKPWIDENDSLKEYYGKLNDKDWQIIHAVLKQYGFDKAVFSVDSEIHKNKVQLLDLNCFSDTLYQYHLTKDLIEFFGNQDGHLIWMPIKEVHPGMAYYDFEPPMIVKTPISADYADNVQRSFMRLICDAYFVIESNLNFIGIIYDDYYMVALVDKNLHQYFFKYLENWEYIPKDTKYFWFETLLKYKQSIINFNQKIMTE